MRLPDVASHWTVMRDLVEPFHPLTLARMRVRRHARDVKGVVLPETARARLHGSRPAGDRPPEFIGVGAQKAGTSWWMSLLLDHPRVLGPRSGTKELHVLEDRAARRLELGDDHATRYAALFPQRDPQVVAGEWTPRYMHDVWGPELLRRLAPDARLLVLLRDPVARFVSGLGHGVAVEGRRPTEADVNDAFARGLYALQLDRLYRAWPREQVLVQVYEACVEDPAAELARTFAHLGVDPTFVPEDLRRRRNGSRVRARVSDEMRAHVRDLYADDVGRLVADHGVDVSRWDVAVREPSRSATFST